MSTPFETMSKQDRATAFSKRFNLERNVIIKATMESMLQAWTAGNAQLLLGSYGQPLIGNNQQIPSATLGTTQPVESTGDPVVDAIIKAINGKVGVKSQDVEAIARKVYADLQLPQRVEVIIKTPEGDTISVGAQHKMYKSVLQLMNLRLNAWIAGPAGSGKTFMISQIAQALNLPFYRVSCGPQTPASVIFGHTTASGGYAPGIAYQALTADGAILLFDEFDRLNPSVAVMVNGLLDGNSVTFPNGETLKPKAQTIYAVCANTFGKPTAEFGTAQRQDTATMSRFVKVHVGIDETLEKDVFGNNDWVAYVQKVRKVTMDLGITSLVVTPRASEYGVKMLADGISRPDVEQMLLWNGIPDEDIKKIKANMR